MQDDSRGSINSKFLPLDTVPNVQNVIIKDLSRHRYTGDKGSHHG
jgi:hypothetical protein